MIRQEKENLYNKFTIEFGDKLAKVGNIIQYLSTYPDITSKIKDLELLKTKDLIESQMEWISIISQLNHPIDKEFFKPYWVPIQSNRYHYFIDLSSETFSFFEVDYFCLEPFCWCVNNIFQNITDLLIIPDDQNIDLRNHMEKVKKENWNNTVKNFNKRDILGFSGKIEPDSVEDKYLFDDKMKYSFNISDNTLVCTGVRPFVVGLLPYDCKIILQYFYSANCRYELDFLKDKIHHIKEFTYLVQSVGYYYLNSFKILLEPEGNEYIYFKDNILKIKHNNKKFFEELIEKIENVKKKLKKKN